ncbi:hypothetical protein EDB83DRAFT_2311410 [Lactarius deliciosus]|nr:hypothetical protein EDB83DRAFT_2311410 [Lactarius deliciosus]
MNITDHQPLSPVPDTLEPNSEPIAREKSTTTARIALSSGPAASTIEARKAKKKEKEKKEKERKKTTDPPRENLPQTDEPVESPDTGTTMPPPSPPPSTPVTPVIEMLLSTPPMTQQGLPEPYPQSDPSVTPPPIKLPTHLSEKSPSPPTSPTPPPRTTFNAPQPSFVTPQDVDMRPVPPRPSPPSTPTQNGLGLRLQPTETTPILKMSTIVARLEEVENDNLGMTGRLSTRTALDKYTPGPMPLIQDTHPTAPFDNIDLKLVEEWDGHQGEKLLAIPFDTEAWDINSHEFIRAKILTALIKRKPSSAAGYGPHARSPSE